MAPQGIPAGVSGFSPVAIELEDGLQALGEHRRVGVEGLDAPDGPARAVIGERFAW